MTRLQPNITKIVETILLLIELAAARGEELTQYQIVKSVFIADLFHLRKFGRPVSFDNYVAMKFGPVPSETYDLLKSHYRWRGAANKPEGWPLWDRVDDPHTRAAKFKNPRRAPNRRKLSATDVSELTDALGFVLQQGFGGIKDWTHELPAYYEAWDGRGERGSNEMDYDRLLDKSDKELVSELVHASKHM